MPKEEWIKYNKEFSVWWEDKNIKRGCKSKVNFEWPTK
jgi:hypothetical protein